jgi:tRNA (cmo5U34)-methyltransferase
VTSALAIHHLDGPGKAHLFERVAAVLAPDGHFVFGDVIIPDDPADTATPIDGAYDRPSTIAEQVGWLVDAGLKPRVVWCNRDLAVVAGEKR